MIFILIQSVMNGTVTMSNTVIGIEANSFIEAKEKVKEFENFNHKLYYEDDKMLSFSIPQEGPFGMNVIMQNLPLMIY